MQNPEENSPSLYVRAEEIMREVVHFLKEDPTNVLGINFPQGWISTLTSHSKRWPYLPPDRQRTVACALQLNEVNQFYRRTFKIGLTAGEMFKWHATLPVIAIIETLCYEVALMKNWVLPEKRNQFEKVINVLNSQGIFKQSLRDSLHELRVYRNEIHLFLKSHVSADGGSVDYYSMATSVLQEVESSMNTYFSP